eukprot:3328545-Amphidinium_carterae.1
MPRLQHYVQQVQARAASQKMSDLEAARQAALMAEKLVQPVPVRNGTKSAPSGSDVNVSIEEGLPESDDDNSTIESIAHEIGKKLLRLNLLGRDDG